VLRHYYPSELESGHATLAKAFKNVSPPEVLFHSGWQAPKISQLREQLKMLSSQRSESHGVAVKPAQAEQM
jgi:hypothetical protein